MGAQFVELLMGLTLGWTAHIFFLMLCFPAIYYPNRVPKAAFSSVCDVCQHSEGFVFSESTWCKETAFLVSEMGGQKYSAVSVINRNTSEFLHIKNTKLKSSRCLISVAIFIIRANWMGCQDLFLNIPFFIVVFSLSDAEVGIACSSAS